jgi:medium-chain acyl-[acyl-carrier-protein] hydrolase
VNPTEAARWIIRPRPAPRARMRLFCLPHAGGGASAFRGWADSLPAEVEVCPVQFPGRENRVAEPAFTSLPALVDALAEVMEGFQTLPFALFGHSNGALVGFELARTLRARGRPGPVHLFASGRRAPDLPSDRPDTHHLPDDEFLAELQTLGGIPQQLLEHRELLELLLPALRADVTIHETYEFREQPPLDLPITAYGGLADPRVSREQLQAWNRHTAGPFVMRMFPGGHFYLHDDRPAVLRTLSADLHAILSIL